MSHEFKVTIGIREAKVVADSESEAIGKAMADLAANVAWAQATRQEPRSTGFRYQAPVPPIDADGDD